MNWCKEKTKINLLIDVIMLVLLMAIAGLGFLIKYTLVPGYKRNVLYRDDVELYFMGLTRHEWGSIHLWLSFVFLFLMILHIILHWKMITCIFRQMVTGKGLRTVIAFFTGLVAMFFVLTPFFVKPEVAPFQVKHAQNYNTEKHPKESLSLIRDKVPAGNPENQGTERMYKNREENSHTHSHDVLEIYGYMTLAEAAWKYSISITELSEALNIPYAQSSEKIGRLKRLYGFEMEELKDTIINLKEKN